MITRPHITYSTSERLCEVFLFCNFLRVMGLAICLFYFQLTPRAQNNNYITGSVWNAETETVIPNASVFLTNTSRGTMTSDSGVFRLQSIQPGNYELVISSIGFTTQVYSFSADKLPIKLKIYLQPKITELATVVIEPYLKNGWKEWGTFFTNQFIGTTDASKLCRIRNYKSLRFRHSKKRNILTVTADEPLIIENRDLGYRMKYQLEEFSYDLNHNILFYLGYILFEDMAQEDKKLPRRYRLARRNAYNGSIMHFIRSLYANQLVENGFEVQRMERHPNLEKERVKRLLQRDTVAFSGRTGSRIMIGNAGLQSKMAGVPLDSSVYYRNVLSQTDSIEFLSGYALVADSLVTDDDEKQRVLYFRNYLQVMYKLGYEEPSYLRGTMQARNAYYPRSFFILKNNLPVVIEKNGSCYPPTELFSSGYWAWSEKVSRLLPADYDNDIGR